MEVEVPEEDVPKVAVVGHELQEAVVEHEEEDVWEDSIPRKEGHDMNGNAAHGDEETLGEEAVVQESNERIERDGHRPEEELALEEEN